MPMGTLRVITARELVVLSGSFTSHFKPVRRFRHLSGHASHERYTVSNGKTVKKKLMELHMPGKATFFSRI